MSKDKNVKDKDILGRVLTPLCLIQEIYGLLSPYLKEGLHVYEPGVGDNRFFENYPLTCTYTGCELSPRTDLPPSIFRGDFFDQSLETYDVILGNPPFRVETTGNGISPIPTKIAQKTIWPDIVKRCFKHLKEGGIMAMILPCIWMKPDKAGIYDLFTCHRILFLRCYSCVESNKLFGYNGQTPVCYVIVQKLPPITFMSYDEGFIPFTLAPGLCIPTKNAGLLQKSRKSFKKSMTCVKIATEIKGNIIENPTKKYPILTTYKNGMLYGVESDTPGLFQGERKVILLHKSSPIPMLDEGVYGVAGRDKYVLDPEYFEFLKLPLVQKIIKSFTIRMNFYEKYVFDYLPCKEEMERWLNAMKNGMKDEIE
jgi:hypothetical protein